MLRCGVHAVVGAMKIGWNADATGQRVTKKVVQEVAKYIHSSECFSELVGSLASRQEAVAAVTNFSFAPQRFFSEGATANSLRCVCQQHHGSVGSRSRDANVQAKVRMGSGAAEADARRILGDRRHACGFER